MTSGPCENFKETLPIVETVFENFVLPKWTSYTLCSFRFANNINMKFYFVKKMQQSRRVMYTFRSFNIYIPILITI